PIPNNNLTEYLSFLEDVGVITGYNDEGLPVYNEHYLCFDPEERLFINGSWQEGLVPHFGVPDQERIQISRFLLQMDTYRYLKGKDGADAFAIPVDQSSRDPVLTRLDSLTMDAWLNEQGYHSEYLRNYINYCCKDDYGTDIHTVSAWAGIHYFASRKGKGANAGHADVLTWPEGNAFLARQLANKTNARIQTGCLVNRIETIGEQVWVDYYDAEKAQQKRCIARHCIMAVPQYIVSGLLNDIDRKEKTRQHLHYVPWIVANLRVQTMPEQHGTNTCWDNVLYNGTGLGYVDATHQLIKQQHTQKNFTYYLPLTNQQPREARKWASNRTKEEWQDLILTDMKKMYPDIEQFLEEINITIWGHAMAQPIPGLIFGKERQLLKESGRTRIHLAHTDLAGISIFEEAFYQGIQAANAILQQTGKKG
ncbi:MAG TPA: FAD-dependent oxidoreductase, partial [Chitinophagaceae bacterium]|nr:FAD-dependent oxidoreductase [Chitinophagaceae bacterium]